MSIRMVIRMLIEFRSSVHQISIGMLVKCWSRCQFSVHCKRIKCINRHLTGDTVSSHDQLIQSLQLNLQFIDVFFSFLYKTDINSGNAEKSEKRKLLESWLNKIMRIKISDGRTLIGSFLCTDQDRNIILGSCQEFVGSTGTVTLTY